MSQHESAPAFPLYERVEAIRLRNGWSKVQLAQKLGLNRGTIENWRTQPRSPQAPTVRDVAERLRIDYTEALQLAGITPGSAPQTEGEPPDMDEVLRQAERNREAAELLALHGRLDAHERRAVRDLARTLAERHDTEPESNTRA